MTTQESTQQRFHDGIVSPSAQVSGSILLVIISRNFRFLSIPKSCPAASFFVPFTSMGVQSGFEVNQAAPTMFDQLTGITMSFTCTTTDLGMKICRTKLMNFMQKAMKNMVSWTLSMTTTVCPHQLHQLNLKLQMFEFLLIRHKEKSILT